MPQKKQLVPLIGDGEHTWQVIERRREQLARVEADPYYRAPSQTAYARQLAAARYRDWLEQQIGGSGFAERNSESQTPAELLQKESRRTLPRRQK